MTSYSNRLVTRLLIICFVLSLYQFAKADFGGFVSLESLNYLEDLPHPTRQNDLQVDLGVKSTVKSKSLVFVVDGEARSQTQSQIPQNQFFAQAKEASIALKMYPITLKAGMNTYNWGIFDIYSPMDVISTQAYFDLLQSKKLSSPVVDVKFEGQSWSLQGLFIPSQTPHILPPEDSRWLPRKVLLDSSVEGLKLRLPDQFEYQYLADRRFDGAFTNNYGFRFSRRFTSADIHLSFFDGVATTPQFEIEASGQLSPTESNTLLIDSDVSLRALFYRVQTSGIQISYILGSYVFKLESTYSHSYGDALLYQKWSTQNAFGLERTITLFGYSSNLIFQGYYGKSDDIKGNLLSSSARLFDESLALALRIGFSTSSSLTFGSLYDLESKSGMVRMNYSFKLLSSLAAEFNIESIFGDEDSLLGSYKANSRARFKLVQRF